MYSNPLAAWGIPGFIILVLAGVVAMMYRQNNLLRDRIEKLQEDRRVDAVTIGTKSLETMQAFSQTVQLIETKLLISKQNGGK